MNEAQWTLYLEICLEVIAEKPNLGTPSDRSEWLFSFVVTAGIQYADLEDG